MFSSLIISCSFFLKKNKYFFLKIKHGVQSLKCLLVPPWCPLKNSSKSKLRRTLHVETRTGKERKNTLCFFPLFSPDIAPSFSASYMWFRKYYLVNYIRYIIHFSYIPINCIIYFKYVFKFNIFHN